MKSQIILRALTPVSRLRKNRVFKQMKHNLMSAVLSGIVLATGGPIPGRAAIQTTSALGPSVPSMGSGKDASPAKTDDQVNSTGGLIYSYPIAWPEGRLGAKPMISVHYSSDAPLRGGLAAGWTLDIPMITGDKSEGTLDADGNTPVFNSFMSSIFGGGKLIRQSNSPAESPNTEIYYALHDNEYIRYERNLPVNNANPTVLWRVYKDGHVYELGNAAHDYFRAPLLRQIDPFGHIIEFTWVTPSIDVNPTIEVHMAQDYVMRRIQYKTELGEVYVSADFTYSVPKCADVLLPLGARLDYTYNQPQLYGSRQLESILIKARRPEQVKTSGDLELGTSLTDVRRYDFDYSNSTSNCDFNLGAPLRRLDSIQEIAYAPVTGTTTVLPPTTFRYGSFRPGMDMTYQEKSFSGLTLPVGEDGVGGETGVSKIWTDMNGDGLVDLLRRDVNGSPSSPVRIYYNTGDGLSSTPKTVHFRHFLNLHPTEDISLGLSGTVKFKKTDLSGSMIASCEKILSPQASIENYSLQDVNNDGLVDLTTEIRYDPAYVDPSPGRCNQPGEDWEGAENGAEACVSPLAPNGQINLCDGAGTGKRLVRWHRTRFKANRMGNFVPIDRGIEGEIPMNTITANATWSQGSGFARNGGGVADFNGDGFTDLLTVTQLEYGRDAGHFYQMLDRREVIGNERYIWIGGSQGGATLMEAFKWQLPSGIHWLSETHETFTDPNDGSADFDQIGNHDFLVLRGLEDMNGDGLADLVYRNSSIHGEPLVYYPNYGQGFVDYPIQLGNAEYLSSNTSFVTASNFGQPTRGLSFATRLAMDINGDGLTDLVELNGYDIMVYANNGYTVSSNPVPFTLAHENQNSIKTGHLYDALSSNILMGVPPDNFGEWHHIAAFQDFTGDGLKDIVLEQAGGGFKLYEAVLGNGSQAPYRLIEVDNGRGARTEINYTSTANSDVVIQDPEADYSIRSPRWVVESIIVHTEGTLTQSMKTEYAYINPVHTRDLFGHSALRGFQQRIKILPSGATVMDRYDFSDHYAGLLIESITYASEDPSNPHQVERYEYKAFAALHDASGAMIDAPYNWHPTKTETFLCSGVDNPSADVDFVENCKINGSKKATTTTWSPLTYTNSSVAATRKPTQEEFSYDEGLGRTRTIRTDTTYLMRADSDEYIVRPSQIIKREILGAASYRNVAISKNFYDISLRKLIQEENYSDGSTKNKTRYLVDDRGLVTAVSSPNIVANNRPERKRIFYDDVGVTQIRTINELDHVINTVVDMGTGATLLTEGPAFKCPGGELTCDWFRPYAVFASTRVEVDGLGRALRTYRSQDDDTAGYVDVLIEINTYNDTPTLINGIMATTKISEILVETNGFGKTRFLYDGLGRELQQKVFLTNTSGAPPPINGGISKSDAVTTYIRDDAGQIKEVSVPDPTLEGGTVSYVYAFDSLGRKLSVTTPDGTVLSNTSYSGLVTTTSEPDSPGAPAAEKRLTHNSIGQLVTVEEKLDDGAFALTTYTYDANGNMATITDPMGDTTVLTHDFAGRRTKIERGGRVWEYKYDHNGNVIAEISPVPAGVNIADYTTVMEYDLLNRLTRRIPAIGGLSGAEQTKFRVADTINVYDGPGGASMHNTIGRLHKSSNDFTSTIYTYDANGQIVSRAQSLFFDENLVPQGTFEEILTYHKGGQLRTVTVHHETLGTLVDGFEYEYDPQGQPEMIRDPRGNALAILDRNHAGLVVRRETILNGNSLNGEWDYDVQGRIESLQVNTTLYGQPSQTVYEQLYDYYGNGMVKQVTESLLNSTTTMDYEWDRRHQLVAGTQTGGPGYTGTFGYDNAGRLDIASVFLSTTNPSVLDRTRVFERDVHYRYDSTDIQRLDSLERPDGTLYADYTTDEAGNVTQRYLDDTGDAWNFRYDGDHRLRQAVGPDGTEIFYYSGPNRVLAVQYNGKARVWFGDLELHFTDGVLTKDWYTVKLGQNVARIENGVLTELTFPTPQNHEAISITADGQIKSGKVYGPFGEVLNSQLAADRDPEDYTREFNGKEFDQVGQLHYYGYRYYDPIAVMWNRADPKFRVVPDAGYDEPRKMNLYTYTLNNPVNLLDPDGLEPFEKTLRKAIFDAFVIVSKKPKYALRDVASQKAKTTAGQRVLQHMPRWTQEEAAIFANQAMFPDDSLKGINLSGRLTSRAKKKFRRRTKKSQQAYAVLEGANKALEAIDKRIADLSEKLTMPSGDIPLDYTIPWEDIEIGQELDSLGKDKDEIKEIKELAKKRYYHQRKRRKQILDSPNSWRRR